MALQRSCIVVKILLSVREDSKRKRTPAGPERKRMLPHTAKLTMDKVGRIVLPKPVREKLQLAPGDELELESLDDRITLRPLRGTAQL